MVFFNFLNFFPFFFFEFSITRREGTEWNEIFFLSHSHPFPNNFRQKCWNIGIFLYFEFFGYFFEILYYALSRNETERKFLFYLIHILLEPILAWNVAILVFFYFLNFLAVFWKFCITRWVGTKRNDNLYFCLFLGHFRPFFAWKEATTVFF